MRLVCSVDAALVASDTSGDGRFAVFCSTATNLVAGRTTRSGSVFLHDTTATHVHPLEVAGRLPEAASPTPTAPVPGSAGRRTPDAGRNLYVTQNARATNLVGGATHVDDVYVTQFDSRTSP